MTDKLTRMLDDLAQKAQPVIDYNISEVKNFPKYPCPATMEVEPEVVAALVEVAKASIKVDRFGNTTDFFPALDKLRAIAEKRGA